MLGYTIFHFADISFGGIWYMYNGNPIQPKRSRMLRMHFFRCSFSIKYIVYNAEPTTKNR